MTNQKIITTDHIGLGTCETVKSYLTVELVDNAIIMTSRDGKSLQNKHGGYSCLHTGSETYLAKKFNSFKDTHTCL
jgi:hypothetical protein